MYYMCFSKIFLKTKWDEFLVRFSSVFPGVAPNDFAIYIELVYIFTANPSFNFYEIRINLLL